MTASLLRRLSRRFRADEEGMVLIFALAFIAFVGVVGVATMSYASTNLKAGVALRPVRGVQYAADAAVEGAINKLRLDSTLPCTTTGDFFRADPPVNGQDIVLNLVDCTSPATLPRDVTFVASCPSVAGTACPANRRLLVARVHYERVTDPATGTSDVTTTNLSWSVN